ncbi:MAG: transaldolase [Sulfurospirillum sp.]|nr:MAG: transaldolase [Sulfurospirillum sp.]
MYIEEGRFSLWCDFVERSFLKSGFRKLLDEKIVNGATSNPAIFKNAFLSSPAYHEDITKLRGKDPKTVYEILAIKDIQSSADLLLNLYEKGDDGFISIEVDPSLCDDAEGTIEEGVRLFRAIDRPNVMIKVPATEAGYMAMEALLARGINVNATLIFSPKQAQNCMEAFAQGSSAFSDLNPQKALPKAVVSIFVSRFDRKMDAIFVEKEIPTGLLGVYNATKIYHDIQKWALPNVRALFASTGVKGEDLPKAYYVTELLYDDSINTAPLETIEALVQTGIKETRAPIDEEIIDNFFLLLEESGIDIKAIYDSLLEEGLDAFKIAFKEILNELEKG